MSGPDELTGHRQEALVAALLTEPTHQAAAAAAGVSEATLRRWLHRPAVRAACREARRRVVEDAGARLQQACGEAVEALRRNLACGNPRAEVRAAQIVLEQAVRGVELADLLARVEELEQLVAEGGDGREQTEPA